MNFSFKQAIRQSVEHLYQNERLPLAQLRKLGLVYGGYRILIAFFFLLNAYNSNLLKDSLDDSLPNSLQQLVSSSYFLLSLILLLLTMLMRRRHQLQFAIGLSVDVVVLSVLLYISKIELFQLMMMYMVVVAVSFMLLTASRAFFITLLAVILVIYQQFFSSGLQMSLISFGNALLMSTSFLAVGFLSWSISQRLIQMELLAIRHSKEVERLHTINQEVISNMVNGVLVIDHNQVVLSNKTACELLEIPQELLNDYRLLQERLLNQHTNLYAWYKNVNNLPSSLIYEPIASDGSSNKILVHRTLLKNHGQLLILQDLRREQANAQQLKLASLGQLTASIAHEIRNPLAVISQASQLLMEDVQLATNDSCEKNNCQNNANFELYEMIFSQTKRVNRIIEDILRLSRQAKPEKQLLSIVQWLEQFLDEHFSEHDIFLHADCHPSVYFDPNQLEQVLINLINNGLRYSSKVNPHAYVEIKTYCIKNNVIIDVLDDGEGVKSQNIAHLFNPFFTTDNNGTGLGLYLSQAFTEANHAKLLYVPEHEKTCFRLMIPIALCPTDDEESI